MTPRRANCKRNEGGVRQRIGQAAMAGAMEIEMLRTDRHAGHGASERGVDQLDAQSDAEGIARRQSGEIDLGRNPHAAIAASVRLSESPSGSARAATRAL